MMVRGMAGLRDDEEEEEMVGGGGDWLCSRFCAELRFGVLLLVSVKVEVGVLIMYA